MRQALDCFQRKAPNTRSPISARSFEPAKRCDSIQSFNASAAGRRWVSSEARISIAACCRAPGRMGGTPQEVTRSASGFDGLAKHQKIAVGRFQAEFALSVVLVLQT